MVRYTGFVNPETLRQYGQIDSKNEVSTTAYLTFAIYLTILTLMTDILTFRNICI